MQTIDISKAIYQNVILIKKKKKNQNVINVAYKPEYPKRANKSRLEDDLLISGHEKVDLCNCSWPVVFGLIFSILM